MARTLDRKLVEAIKRDIVKSRKWLRSHDSTLTDKEVDDNIRMGLLTDIDGICGVVPCPTDHVDQAFKELAGFSLPPLAWAGLGFVGITAIAVILSRPKLPMDGLGAVIKGKYQYCSSRAKKGCIAEDPIARWDSKRQRYKLRWPNGEITYKTKGEWTKLKRQLRTRRERIIRRRTRMR